MPTVFGRDVAEKSTGSRRPGAQPRMLTPAYQRDALATALSSIGRQQAMNLQPDPTLGAPFSSFPDNRLTVAQMGPGQPAENFPLGGEPRQWQYRVGRNFPTTPDSDRGISGQFLRALADASWLVRKCLEVRKQELCSLEWEIVPRGQDAKERKAGRLKHGALISHIREFLRYPEAYFALAPGEYEEHYPDGRMDRDEWERRPLTDWTDWLNACLEDVFVGDWLSLWPQRTIGNELLGLRRVDGEHIKVIIDLDGRTPPPPMPAYQQYLFGTPRASWSADEFYFLPRNMRNMTTFGYSLIEQCPVIINLVLKFDQWNTSAYTDSTMPMGLLETPQGMPAPQIQDIADVLNGAIADLGARQRINPVPAGTKFQAIKPFNFDPAYCLYLIEGVCACMDVQPQELGFAPARAGMGGSGHAETQDVIGRRKSLLPTARWFERKMTRIINEQWGREGGRELEWRFTDLVHAEKAARFTAYKAALESGQVSLDELMEETGEPGPGLGRTIITPQGTIFVDKHFVLTSNGIVPLKLPEPGAPAIFGPHQPPQPGEPGTPEARPVPKAQKAADEDGAGDRQDEKRKRRKELEEAFLLLWLGWWQRRLRRVEGADVLRPEIAERALHLTYPEQDELAQILQESLRGAAYAEAMNDLRVQAGLPERATTEPTRSDVLRLQTGSQTHMVQVAQTYHTDLQDAYQRLLEETAEDPDNAHRARVILEGLIRWARARANHKGPQVAITELTDAQSQAARDFATQNPRELSMFRWRAMMDNNTCDVCAGLDGQVVSVAGPHPPAHPNCLPGNARVVARGVSAASKRWYDGNLIVIRTASGKKLACTPNHPILTPGGWVAARLLHKGGHVISSSLGQWGAALVVTEHQDMPPTIEEVAGALGRSLGVASAEVPLSSEDFHGDGEGSEIAVVWADGMQALEDGAPESVELAREILAGSAGPVFQDEIVNVDVEAFRGHVFNLQTSSESYVAEGMVTHNCRCWLAPVEPNTGAP